MTDSKTISEAAAMSAKDSQALRLSTKLMKLLDEETAPTSLWWIDNQIFAVDPKFFQAQVLDPHFRGTKYASFLRTMHKMGFARLSRRFDLPKGVVAYACELFQKGKPELLKQIKMNNSGKQSNASKAAIAALILENQNTKENTAKKSGTSANASGASKTTSKGTKKKASAPKANKTVKPASAAVATTGATAPPAGLGLAESAFSANFTLARQQEEDRLRFLRGSMELQDQAARTMMLRNASLLHQPIFNNMGYPSMLPPRSLPMSSLSGGGAIGLPTGTGTSGARNQLLELALMREAMNNNNNLGRL